MKKRLFAIALSLCMTLSLLPTAAFAAEPGGGGTSTTQGEQSGSLTQQIKQSKDATVNLKLQGDHTESVTISKDKNVVLDLGTYKLSGQGGPAICVEDGATLTIKGTGTVDSSNNDFGNIVNDGTVTIEGNITFDYLVPMNQKKDNATWNVYSNISNHGTMTIKGGTFEYRLQQGQQPDNATWNVYDNIDNFGKLEITDGTFTGGKETIKNNGNGTKATISITGGTFDNDPAQFVATGYGGLWNGNKFEVLKQAKVNFAPTGGNLTWQVYEGDTLNNNLTWTVYVGKTFVEASANYETFPTYKMEGYEDGSTWKWGETPVDGGTTVTSAMIGTNGIMNLVPDAKKTVEPEKPVEYSIKAASGDITLTEKSAKKGDTVTFTVKEAEKGYTAYVSVTAANNENVVVTKSTAAVNEYSFTMPASDVTVAVKYVENIKNDKVEDTPRFSAGENKTKDPDTTGNTKEEADAMNEVHTNLGKAQVDKNTLTAAAKQIVANGTVDLNKVTTTKENADKIAKLLEGKGEDAKATIVVVPFLEIQVNNAEVKDGVVKSVTINVTPMVTIKATCGNDEAILGQQELKVTTTISMTLPVPASWTGNTAFVGHKGYVYTGSVYDKAVAFQNPHGFSDFTVNSENPAVATNNNSNAQYTDLALAINEAQAKDIITLTDKANGANVNTNRDNKTVTLKKADGVTDEVKVTVNGTEYTVTTEGISLTTPRASSGGGGGGGSASTGYTVTANSSKNGSVSVTPKNASKGDTVTVTVKADKGYELSTLTVTDKDGNTVKLTDKGNGKYTFTMPGSKVEVKAEFVEISTDSTNPFRDVSKNAYYYKQVLWAVEKGITSGVSANEFAPEAACTRGQMVTFLWKAAGSPEVSGTLAFNDVSADAYYAKAVRWAAQQGITSGTSAGMFSPNAPCTRGQMAMFLYAYAKNPAVTGSVPFSDVASGDYFNTAVLWAVNNGITSGTSSTTYSPASVCTRGQMVVFLYQLLNK